jgi:pimeloyl-ACP methyl ester carboxylesterase
VVRTILTWRILDENLVGTLHVAAPGRAGGLSGAPSVGILLLNPGSAPRSGNSDLSVRIGDRLALRGFPVFRFDLPGLGDSSGAMPADVDAYWGEVVSGRNDAATIALIERIRLEFGVARVIVGGLCAAALPSVRALSRGRAGPAGLILLEPSFRLTDRSKPAGPRIGTFARAARSVRARLQPVLRRRVGAPLPRDANVPLVRRWQEGFGQGVRSLVVVATGPGTDRYMTRILASMPARDPGVVSCVRVPETNHLFTSGAGREGVLAAVESWVMECFPGNAEPVARLASGS